VSRFRETGSVQARPRQGRPPTAITEDTTVMVLGSVAVNPHISSRAIATDVNISRRSVLRILHTHRFHPYHVHCHQALEERDYDVRVDFSNWLLAAVDDDPHFLSKILWTDEAQFSRDGVVNIHNMHYWADENPRWLRQTAHQEQWRTNVWCGILGDRIVGPVFYDGTLNRQRYRDLILNGIVTTIVDNMPLQAYRETWYQHDGAPPHFAIISRQWLDDVFPGRWIGRGGPVAWPPRSPDLTPLDFFLWGHIKTVVYERPTTTLLDLQERISVACREIQPDTFARVRQAIQHRTQLCIGSEGRHVEHLLD
jgi:hypothetical protein